KRPTNSPNSRASSTSAMASPLCARSQRRPLRNATSQPPRLRQDRNRKLCRHTATLHSSRSTTRPKIIGKISRPEKRLGRVTYMLDIINSRLSIAARLGLLSALFIAPTVLLGTLFVTSSMKDVAFAENETRGATYLKALWPAVVDSEGQVVVKGQEAA